jgi:hypothetical protein
MSSACVGHKHHRWPRVPAQSGGQSRHRHSSGRQCSDTSKTRRRGWRRGTQRSPRWTGVYPGNPPNLHQCRPSAQRKQSIAREVHNPGWLRHRCHVDADATMAEGADASDEEVGCEGRCIVYRGPELLHLVIMLHIEGSIIESPNRSNSMEHQLSVVK